MKWTGKISLALATVATLFSAASPPAAKAQQKNYVPLYSTNLRMDPFELAKDEGMDYQRWYAERMFAFAPAAGYVAQWLQSFREFPPRQKPGTFNLDRVMESVTGAAAQKTNN